MFVDETQTYRRFRYSLREKPEVSKKVLVRGQRVSTIAAMLTEGILDCYMLTGSINGSKFSDFVQETLLP